MNGDLNVFAEWGSRFWELGTQNFYFDKNWQYSFPTYPPLSSLMYGFLGWVYDNKSILLVLHNVTKLPPSSFIINFYATGYNLILKLPAILADIALSFVIYKIVLNITKDKKKSLLAFVFYILNPLTIFLSGVWGQTESLIALFGILAFWALHSKKVYLSIPLLFVSLYIKPTWIILAPLYLFLIRHLKVKTKHIVIGGIIAFVIFCISTIPFSQSNLLSFTSDIVVHNMLPGAKGTARTSISAFNFWAIITQIDWDFVTKRFLFIPANWWGWLAYILINIFTFSFIKKQKNKLLGTITGIFIIGLGSFLFMTNMLERYFFASFAPLVILIFVRPKLSIYLIAANIILFLNLIWAFYRRSSDEIGHPFTDNNFLLLRLLSLVLIGVYYKICKILSSKTSDTISL